MMQNRSYFYLVKNFTIHFENVYTKFKMTVYVIMKVGSGVMSTLVG